MVGRALAGVVAAASALTVTASTGGAVLARPHPATPAAPTGTRVAAAPRQVVLPTGDRVRLTVGQDGRPQLATVAAPREASRGLFETFSLGGEVYVVPRDANALAEQDLSRFDVSRLAGLSPGAPAVQPQFAMQTLTLHGVDATGMPDSGDAVVLVNVDDMRKYSGFAVFNKGVAKVSVPAGNYSAFGYFFDPRNGATQAVVLPQFTVTGDRAVSVDARRATSTVTVATPRPARPAVMSLDLARADERGALAEFSAEVDPSAPVEVQPVTRAPSVGALHYVVSSRLFSPRSAAPAYSYDLEFPSDGVIPANQHYVASAAGLAEVDSTYTATRQSQHGLDGRFAALPWQSFLFADLFPVSLPMRRTEYYTARSDLSWQADVVTVFHPARFDLLGEYESPAQVFEPGTRTSTVWGNGQPVAPVLEQGQVFPGLTICPACTDGSGDRLYLLAFPFGDGSQHFGWPDWPVKGLTESVSYAVDADGVRVARGTGMLDASVALPAGTRRYRIAYRTVRSSADFTLSTAVTTAWSLPRTAAAAPAPDGWTCSDQAAPATCRVLPLMTARYALGTDSLGRLAPGRHTAAVTVGHLAGAASVGVETLHTQVSFDGGATWTPAHAASRGAGRYRVRFTVPATARTDGFGSLRVTAADAGGGTFTQTVQRAFAVTR